MCFPCLCQESGDKKLRYSAEHKENIIKYKSVHEDIITCIEAIDDNIFLAADIDGILSINHYPQISNTNSIQSKTAFNAHCSSITSIVNNTSLQYCITSSRDKSIKFWKYQNRSFSNQTSCLFFENVNQPMVHFSDAHSKSVSAMDENQMSHKLWSGGRDACIKLWDIEKESIIFSTEIHRNLPRFIKVCQTNSNLMIECCEDLKIRVWDERMSENNHISCVIECGPQIPLYCDIYGNQIIVSFNGFNGNGCELKLIDIRNSDQSLLEWQAHNESVVCCKFSNCNDRQMEIVSASKDHTIKQWRIVDQCYEEINMVEFGNGMCNKLSFVNSNQIFVAGNDGKIFIVNCF